MPITQCAMIFLLAAALPAAAASRLEGTWMRDGASSDAIGGPIGGTGRAVDSVTLVIEDRGDALQVTRKVAFGGGEAPPLVQRFPLDGKETVNPAPAPGGRRGEVRTKARREGALVIVEGVQQITMLNGGIYVSTTDVYEVSADGKTLTVTTTRTNPQGTQKGKQVYRKN